jgi:membrane-associated phospholipid phosphatase
MNLRREMLRNTRWALPVALCMLGAAALRIDLPVARFARDGRVPGQVKELLENLEPFGHGAGVAVIALVVCCLETRRRWKNTGGVLLAAFGSGLAANALKLLIRRDRPWELADGVSHALETFGGYSASWGGTGGGQSFPSAHSATAMGLAMALAAYYPRGRFVYGALAIATATARALAPSHFVSDTLVGLALGMAIGQVVIASRRFRPQAAGDERSRVRKIDPADGRDDCDRTVAA